MRFEFSMTSHAQRGTVFIAARGPFFDKESGVSSVSISVIERDRFNEKVENKIEVLVEVAAIEVLAASLASMANQCRRLENEEKPF